MLQFRGESEAELEQRGARLVRRAGRADASTRRPSEIGARAPGGRATWWRSSRARPSSWCARSPRGSASKHMLYTRLEVEDGRFTGRVIEPICFEEGKIYWLQQLIEEQRDRPREELVLHRLDHRPAAARPGRPPGRGEPRSAALPRRGAPPLAGALLRAPSAALRRTAARPLAEARRPRDAWQVDALLAEAKAQSTAALSSAREMRESIESLRDEADRAASPAPLVPEEMTDDVEPHRNDRRVGLFGAFACASQPPPSLVAARNSYHQAACDVLVAIRGAGASARGEAGPRPRESCVRERRGDSRGGHLSYLATRRVEIARELAKRSACAAGHRAARRSEERGAPRRTHASRLSSGRWRRRGATPCGRLADELEDLQAKQTERGLVLTLGRRLLRRGPHRAQARAPSASSRASWSS